MQGVFFHPRSVIQLSVEPSRHDRERIDRLVILVEDRIRRDELDKIPAAIRMLLPSNPTTLRLDLPPNPVDIVAAGRDRETESAQKGEYEIRSVRRQIDPLHERNEGGRSARGLDSRTQGAQILAQIHAGKIARPARLTLDLNDVEPSESLKAGADVAIGAAAKLGDIGNLLHGEALRAGDDAAAPAEDSKEEFGSGDSLSHVRSTTEVRGNFPRRS